VPELFVIGEKDTFCDKKNPMAFNVGSIIPFFIYLRDRRSGGMKLVKKKTRRRHTDVRKE